MKSTLLLAGIALALAGCSSVPTEVDTGPIRAATFSFVQRRASPNAAQPDNMAQVHGLIQQALRANLASKGLAPVAAGGDVTVAYLLVTGNNASTTMTDDYFGYGRAGTELLDKAHASYTTSKNPNEFEAGTLLVDLVDTRTFKLLRRVHVTRPLLRNPTAETRAANIQEAVDSALRDVRVVR
jgi:hypothetical protein